MQKINQPSSPLRHSFSAEDRVKSVSARREAPKNIGRGEAKRLICERLRDKNTDARSFVKLFLIYTTKFHKLGRGPKNPATLQPELSIEEMVQKIEAGELGRMRVVNHG